MSFDPQKSEAELLDRCDAVVQRSRQLGADAAEVTISRGSEFSCTYRGESLDKLEEAGTAGLGLRLFVDGRTVAGSTSDLRPEVVDGLIRELLVAAPHLDRDEYSTLAPLTALDGVCKPMGIFDPATVVEATAPRLARARAAEAAARGFDKRIVATEGAGFGGAYASTATVASNGLRRAVTGSSQSLVADAICDDSGGKKRNGYYYSYTRALSALKAPEVIGAEAARRALARIGAAKPRTGDYPVVFSPEAGPGLLGLFVSCATATAVWRKQTYLAERLGDQVANPLVTIIDDPLIEGLLGSSNCDGEGRARKKNILVEGGELKLFLAAQYSANRTGMEPTASAGRPLAGRPGEATTNLFLKPGSISPESLIASVQEGIYIEGTLGFGFNPVTGDFSRGAFGRMIRGGALAEPIAEFTISASFDKLFGGIDAIADNLIWEQRSACPTFKVASMAVGGAG